MEYEALLELRKGLQLELGSPERMCPYVHLVSVSVLSNPTDKTTITK